MCCIVEACDTPFDRSFMNSPRAGSERLPVFKKPALDVPLPTNHLVAGPNCCRRGARAWLVDQIPRGTICYAAGEKR
jgi:hypothetical protein